ncbi:MAG: carbohydrate ABC transporter permease [Deinococcota bacterium]|nr:carbohydrate ABC transporter permease [Deinococcota bacterium]
MAALISFAALVWLFPFIWALLSSLKLPGELATGSLSLPRELFWQNYTEAYAGLNYVRSLRNSFIFAGGAAVLQCITGTLAAFAFARMNFPGKEIIFMMMLATLMIPTTVTLTANFLILSNLGWINTFFALIVPNGASGFAIFLLRQFFMTIPIELEESARLDGAGRLRFLWHIVVPLSRPALITVFIFVFISSYNDFLWPLIMTSSRDMRVLQIGLQAFSDELGSGIVQGPLMAAAILVMIPTIILFMFLQQAFIRGITRSGLK